jgi:hypothetical protein
MLELIDLEMIINIRSQSFLTNSINLSFEANNLKEDLLQSIFTNRFRILWIRINNRKNQLTKLFSTNNNLFE